MCRIFANISKRTNFQMDSMHLASGLDSAVKSKTGSWVIQTVSQCMAWFAEENVIALKCQLRLQIEAVVFYVHT